MKTKIKGLPNNKYVCVYTYVYIYIHIIYIYIYIYIHTLYTYTLYAAYIWSKLETKDIIQSEEATGTQKALSATHDLRATGHIDCMLL